MKKRTKWSDPTDGLFDTPAGAVAPFSLRGGLSGITEVVGWSEGWATVVGMEADF